MVARIKSGQSIKGAINYNEHKIDEGKAVLLMAEEYPKEAQELHLKDNLLRLQKLPDMNPRVTTNCVHISLNFNVSEKLTNNKLRFVSGDYMNRIGFGMKPYLVYRHDDPAHQHVHVVTTNIQKDGKRILYTTWEGFNPKRHEKRLKSVSDL
jgi:hypothetical protein